jgi:hypothetical protein
VKIHKGLGSNPHRPYQLYSVACVTCLPLFFLECIFGSPDSCLEFFRTGMRPNLR